MIANRDFGLDDYLAMLRRRLRIIVIPAIVAAFAGLLASFAVSPKYTSHALVLVQGQTVPTRYVKPIVTEAAGDRIANLLQQVLSRNRLAPVVDRLGLTRRGVSVDEVIDEIRNNVSVTPADPSAPPSGPASANKLRAGQGDDNLLGFYVSFTAHDARDAQQICAEVTSLLLEENLKAREQVALSTGDFLSRQLNEAKQNLDEQDRKLANFKRQYLGQLPGDVDDNLKILMTLNSQLDANTQMLNRAQEDKSFTESVLAQQIAAWKSSQASLTSETMEQQLAALQTQLVALQARYTDDHPEVVKAKNDIAALEAKQKAMISSAKAAASDTPEGKAEPPEILQLRQEIHQYEDTITRGTSEQKSLQEQIATGRSRLAISPEVEEQYKQLTRDSDTAHTLYDTLLANKSESAMQTDMEHQQQGEHMTLLDPADLPASPSFPNRWQFAGGGLGVGLALGLSIAMWLEFQNKAMRDEKDVQAALELPTLTSVPWVGSVASRENSGFSDRFRTLWDQKKTAGV